MRKEKSLFHGTSQADDHQFVNPLYLDHAATSWPKPPGVAEAMVNFLEGVGANPGRSGHHRSLEAAREVYEAREAVAELFGVSDPLRVAFGLNLTEGLNLALRGGRGADRRQRRWS